MKSRSKLILLYISLLLQSCYSIRNDKLNIKTVTEKDLSDNNDGVFSNELKMSINNLKKEGFIGDESEDDHIDMKKHLMFIFYHSLKFKRSNTPWTHRFGFFSSDPNITGSYDSEGLIWEPIAVKYANGEIAKIEFVLRHLFAKDDPNRSTNLVKVKGGRAPFVKFSDDFMLIKDNSAHTGGYSERVEIDHLLRDNKITIELPESLHHKKTKFIDKLFNAPEEKKIRDSRTYWKDRLLP